jgi:hypothetical protein
MVRDGLANTDNYKKYWDEYILYSMAFDKLKMDYRINYIIPNAGDDFSGGWEVDFTTKEIMLYD